MEPIDTSKLSLDYLLENKVITILSRDYVLECGILWGDAELNWDECGYFTVDRNGVNFTGLTYQVYDHKYMMRYPFFNTDFQDGTLMYYTYFVNGLQDGVDVEFYPSGAVHSYSVYDEGRLVGKSYEWYENGMIKKYIDCNQNIRILFDKQGKITKQGKA